jgi:general secretion pathway protein M
MIATWRARWEALGARERRFVILTVALVVIVLLWTVAVGPAWRTLRDAPVERARLDVDWATMQRQAAEVRGLRAAPPITPALASQSLQAATARLGGGARLALQGERAVLTLNGIDGPALIQWLAEVRQGARARPVEATLNHGDDGYAGTIVLQLGARG